LSRRATLVCHDGGAAHGRSVRGKGEEGSAREGRRLWMHNLRARTERDERRGVLGLGEDLGQRATARDAIARGHCVGCALGQWTALQKGERRTMQCKGWDANAVRERGGEECHPWPHSRRGGGRSARSSDAHTSRANPEARAIPQAAITSDERLCVSNSFWVPAGARS